MSKIRIYDLAKEVGKTNKEVMEILAGLGIEVKSASSSIEEAEAGKLKASVSSGSAENKTAEKSAKPVAAQPKRGLPLVKIKQGASVADVASSVGEKSGKAVKILMNAGLMISAVTAVDDNLLGVLGEGFGRNFVFAEEDTETEKFESFEEKPVAAVRKPDKKHDKKVEKKAEKKAERQIAKQSAAAKEEETEQLELTPRPPIITVMGHVDHGKTTLLDYIRNTHVTNREAGGITQHIGASCVNYNGNTLVFLDTPGHEAFTAMRARGAQVTDVAILVVAADDGLMPQTIEALNHAKAANVPIIVAVNKMDKPQANPDRVRQQLSDYGLVPEEWGGDTVMVNLSAKTGEHVNELLEMIILVAELQELKAAKEAKPQGTVVEANLDKGKGPVATVIVQNGTLKRGDIIYTDTAWGKIRAMLDDKGNMVSSAGPSMPVEILGLENVPQPGEIFKTFPSEREARDFMSQKEVERREQMSVKAKRVTLEELYDKMQGGETPQLHIVLKTDVQGSLEAFHASLVKMSTEAVSVNIVHEGVGRISESDVMLAAASNAVIIGFNVRPDSNAKKIAETEGIQVRLYQVIYDMLDDVKAAMEGMLAPEIRENTLGQAEIRDIIRVPKVGNIAGCRVLEGSVKRGSVRLIRDGVVFWTGELASLKHFKDDAREVKAGNECGLSFAKFQDFRVGDIVESFEILKEKRTLD